MAAVRHSFASQGLSGLAAMVGLGHGARRLPFAKGCEPNSVAVVVLPTELLQVRLQGVDQTELVVQAIPCLRHR